jgi:predicted DNA-binding protein
MLTVMADSQKSFLLKLDDEAHERLAAAAARAGVSMQVYARDAIDAAAQEDEILGLAADALAGYGEAFGLDPAGNARKVAELRSRTRAVA